MSSTLFTDPENIAQLFSAEGLKNILDGIGEGFYAVDPEWRIVLFNSEASRHFGLASDVVFGRNLWDLFPQARETGLGQLFLTAMKDRQTVRSETESVLFRGHWLAYRLFPLADGMGIVFRDITDRRNAEMQRDVLIKELEHRIKNTLTMVQSIAEQTFRGPLSDQSLLRTFTGRLVSLSNAHAVLTRRSWDCADLHELVSVAIGPHRGLGSDQFVINGPILRVKPVAAVALSMAVHELCTNAIKYGALSAEFGWVQIEWHVDHDQFHWTWLEQNGPIVVAPERSGFGSRLIERLLAAQLSGKAELKYNPTGLICEICAPISRMCEA